MANKTIQALKISATVDLKPGSMHAIETPLIGNTKAAGAAIASAKLRFVHAFAARHDDPAYQARVTERIASIKAALADIGTIATWHVTAGAVPVAEAEVLADEAAE